jgi:hypothetical protein
MMMRSPDPIERRRAGQATLRRLTTWIGMGAVVLSGVVAAAVAHSLPGRTAAATATSTSGSGAAQIPSTGSGGQGTAPAPVAPVPAAVSGGS